MRDLGLVGFLGLLLAMGFRRPFLFVLAYAYVDIVSPQRLSYYLLNSIPVSLICFALALGGWLFVDDKRDTPITARQILLIALLGWAGWTTLHADLPEAAPEKWEWVWKSLVFAIFLPLTLRTRLRIEALLLFMVLSASSIIVVGGIKTLASGGGYGALNLMVDNNSGLYEGSTISTVAIAIIPLILWFTRHGTVFPPEWKVTAYAWALCFACLLIPVGTEARTGLICIAALAVLMLRAVKRRLLYLGLMAAAAAMAVPFLPQSFTQRMDTIAGYQADTSASTRIAVWAWTWDYVKQHPMGGGFEAYRQNRLVINKVETASDGAVEKVDSTTVYDRGRAYHSAYFEMLGEQGFLGLFLWLLLHAIGIWRMERIRRQHLRSEGDRAWIAPLATALQHGHIIYMVGSLFVGIAFQPFVYMLIAAEIGFDSYVTKRLGGGRRRGFAMPAASVRPMPAGAPQA